MSWRNSEQRTLGLADPMLLEHRAMKKFDSIDNLIDWGAIEKQLKGIHNKRRGCPAYPPLRMFKVLLLQAWHGIGDTEMEDQLVVNSLFRRFTGFDSEARIPDHSTIWRFREQMQKTGLLEKVLDEINRQLERQNYILKGEKVAVDSTVIKAARSRPKKNRQGKNTQDPEAAYNVKTGSDGKKTTTYSYKLHAMTDADGMVQKLAYTPGNVHDSQMLAELLTGDEQEVYADSAYASKKTATMLGNKNRVLHRAYRNRPLTKQQRHENRRRRKTRNVVERTFAHLKLYFNLAKARYLGKARNYAFALLAAIAYNLKRAALKSELTA